MTVDVWYAGFVYRLRWDKLNKQWTDFRLHPTKIAFFSVSTRMWPSGLFFCPRSSFFSSSLTAHPPSSTERQWLVDKVTVLSQEMGTQVSLVPPSEPEADESEAYLRIALPT
jgi:hypothetical protein